MPEPISRSKKFRIPNVDVLLDDVEVEIVNTREFQRLFDLKQLGLAYLVYPGATHTRGVHSIETLYQANRILDALEASGQEVKPSEREAVRLAALLHDIGHIPFSHTLEDEHMVLTKPHDGTKRLNDIFALLRESIRNNVEDDIYYRKIDKRLDAAFSILVSVASKAEDTKDWKSDLVGNTICADLLAYINADAAWTGIEKRPGHYRIYDYFRVESKRTSENNGGENQVITKTQKRLCIALTKKGVLRVDIVSAILDILDIRYAITERVLFHHAKCVASSMLARAAKLCGLQDSDCETDVGGTGGVGTGERRNLLHMGDEVFLDFLEDRAIKSGEPGVLRLIQSLRSRRLYKRVFKVSRRMKDAYDSEMPAVDFITCWRDSDKVEAMLSSVEAELGLQKGALVLWCSDAKSGMKAVKVNVTWEIQGHYAEPRPLREVKEFPTVHQRVQAIEQQYSDLWCFWVAVDKRYSTKSHDIAQAVERHVGLSCDRLFKESLYANLDMYQSDPESYAFNQLIYNLLPVKERLAALEAPALNGKDSAIDQVIVRQMAIDVLQKLNSPPAEADLKGSKRSVKTKAMRSSPENHKVSEKEQQLPLGDDKAKE